MTGARVPFAGGHAPPWATEWGKDRYGYFAAFRVREVVQRLRWIRPEVFLMGSPETEEGRLDWEGPRHEVELTQGYWLGDTPVTRALWDAVMDESSSRNRGENTNEHPVQQVSWDDCQRFCAQVNERVPGIGLGLPSEAQWECACRGGTEGATWLGANDADSLNKIAWWSENSGGSTHAVRGKAANPYGLYDMLGNVWEWCGDDMRTYERARVCDPFGVLGGSSRVSRGGSFDWDARLARAAARSAFAPSPRYGDLGFRVSGGQGLRSSPEQEPESRSDVGTDLGEGRAARSGRAP